MASVQPADKHEAAEGTGQEILQNTVVVDCDVHAAGTLLEDKKASLLEEPFSSYLRAEARKVERFHPYDGFPRSRGGRQKVEVAPLQTAEDIQERLVEEFGVDHPILNQVTAGLNVHPNTDYAVQEMRAANDMFIEQFMDEHSHFRGVCTVHLAKPDAAAEELDRLADEKQIVGTMISDPGGRTYKPEGDPEYDVFWQAAEDNDMTVTFHSTSGNGAMVEFPILTWGLQKWVQQHSLSHPMSHQRALASIITEGIPEKFPDLNVVFVEAGIGWVPMMISRLNRLYRERPEEAPELTKPPEEYIREQCYFGTQPLSEPARLSHLQQMLDVVGADSIVFSTDFPHFDFDNPEAIDTYLRSHFTAEERDKVLRDNAVEAYGLSL